MKSRQLKPCGTFAAYLRHLRHREVPCETCREAVRVAAAEQRRRAGVPERGPLRPCGTPAAYSRHYAHGEKPCETCREAHAKAYRQARKESS
ncbi:hypothetical protein [Nocardiopsis dassonvillei]|uniref:hypothetical protein n=1 Tax=Nocardiopsis dassonvillei TaxID=2014 RepID=UPI00363F095A